MVEKRVRETRASRDNTDMQSPMSGEPQVIELATLPQRHPTVGDAMLNLFGAQTVLRLGLDPVRTGMFR